MVRNGGWYYLEGWLQRLVVCMVRNGGWYYLEGWLQRLVVFCMVKMEAGTTWGAGCRDW
jgi:hypothetical protein